jgi:DNA-binding NtrC family response regulator
MPYRDTKTLSARAQIQQKFVKRAAKLVNVFQCLIISADTARREMLQRAAEEGGWKTSLCGDVPSALVHLRRSFVQLALVDLEGQKRDAFQLVIEQLTARSGLLLVVCGNETDVEEEVWARQQGAWLYLPGVVETSNLALLCGEARHIAERVGKANGSLFAAPVAQRKSS